MSRRVTGRRENDDAAVAENVAVALELGDRMLRLEARRVVGARPIIFGLLHIAASRCGNISTLPTWSGWVCEIAIALMSDGLTPS